MLLVVFEIVVVVVALNRIKQGMMLQEIAFKQGPQLARIEPWLKMSSKSGTFRIESWP